MPEHRRVHAPRIDGPDRHPVPGRAVTVPVRSGAVVCGPAQYSGRTPDARCGAPGCGVLTGAVVGPGARARRQPPVPAASSSVRRRAASNSGAHGPWPATTYGDCSTCSNVSASVTYAAAQGPMLARFRSNAARLRKTYR